MSRDELREWRLLESFGARVAELAAERGVAASWADPRRHLLYGQYLSLFLFGLVNPVLRTVRALSAASRLERVQREVCGRRVSLGSFSEAQSLVDPAFLEALFGRLAGEIHGPPPKDPREAALYWLAQDSSLWRALPRMDWAIYGGGRAGAPNRAVRLHLGFHLLEDKPVVVQVSPGRLCERKAWRQQWQRGAAYVGDRYYGEDYGLFAELEAHGCHFVVRSASSPPSTSRRSWPWTPRIAPPGCAARPGCGSGPTRAPAGASAGCGSCGWRPPPPAPCGWPPIWTWPPWSAELVARVVSPPLADRVLLPVDQMRARLPALAG
ncbi:MAG: transposase [Chthoniobacter sp.]|nr:transposase [Chthoniobacter sp.]